MYICVAAVFLYFINGILDIYDFWTNSQSLYPIDSCCLDEDFGSAEWRGGVLVLA